MATFVVLLNQPQAAVATAIHENFPEYRRINDRTYFLKADSTAFALSKKLFTDQGIMNGAIAIRVSADYYGYSNTDFWDWLANSFKGPDGG